MKVLQINVTSNFGSTGRIAAQIGDNLLTLGNRSIIAYGRYANRCDSEVIKIGSVYDQAFHLLKSRLFDLHGFGSGRSTVRFVRHIEQLDPDIIHLHNLHGYYIHVGVLFDYLRSSDKPVVWTLHDCWSFTGHCSHYQNKNCDKWKTHCNKCPNLHGYPESWSFDNSYNNFIIKKRLFTSLKKLVLVSPSEWLVSQLGSSFLSDYPVRLINTGIDLNKFKPVDPEEIRIKYGIRNKYILGVANVWTMNKGLNDFLKLRENLKPEIDIVLVGLTEKQAGTLKPAIKGISRTKDIGELAALYTGAEIFINPTYVDNFPTTNIESLACGTPVITYNTGGSPEAINNDTGKVVKKGDLTALKSAVSELLLRGKGNVASLCRERAEKLYDSNRMCLNYISLYNERSFPDANLY